VPIKPGIFDHPGMLRPEVVKQQDAKDNQADDDMNGMEPRE